MAGELVDRLDAVLDEFAGLERTPQQRRADALVEMAMRSATAPADGLRPRPLFTVTNGIDPFNHLCQTAAGTVIAPGLLIPLLGDADIERIVYDPPARRIEASWRRRFTSALRRIIEIRDQHCQHPSGCDEPAQRCDADHIVPRSHGGTTCPCNGQLLCAHHNRTVKAATDKSSSTGGGNRPAAPLPPPRTPPSRPRRHHRFHRSQPRPTPSRLNRVDQALGARRRCPHRLRNRQSRRCQRPSAFS